MTKTKHSISCISVAENTTLVRDQRRMGRLVKDRRAPSAEITAQYNRDEKKGFSECAPQ